MGGPWLSSCYSTCQSGWIDTTPLNFGPDYVISKDWNISSLELATLTPLLYAELSTTLATNATLKPSPYLSPSHSIPTQPAALIPPAMSPGSSLLLRDMQKAAAEPAG